MVWGEREGGVLSIQEVGSLLRSRYKITASLLTHCLGWSRLQGWEKELLDSTEGDAKLHCKG